MNDKYILDENNNVVPAKDLFEWANFFEDVARTGRRIVNQEYVDDFFVSTVFLGLDHGAPHHCKDFNKYKPLIFETIVFKKGSGFEEYCDRYSTWQEAEEGHKIATQWVKDGCKD